MKKQKERSRSKSDFKDLDDTVDWEVPNKNILSNFIGYEDNICDSEIVNFRNIDDKKFEIMLNQTPFYAESGGQIGDIGFLESDNFLFEVLDTKKKDDNIIHIGIIKNGKIKLKEKVNARIDESRRKKIKSNHTATHLMHKALKEVLGDHVQQSGSLVADDRLRFDLTHYEKINQNQIQEIEKKVNNIIRENLEISTNVQSFEDARTSGAVALFGEKYGDKVRVVDVPGFSMEFCGGTHVSRTGDIGLFKIISESSLSSGVRRIEAVTGKAAIDRINYIESIIQESKNYLKISDNQIIDKILSLINKNKELEKKLKLAIYSDSNDIFSKIISNKELFLDTNLIFYDLGDYDGDLKELGDQFRATYKGKGIIVLSSIIQDKVNMMCAITDDLTSFLDARDIAKKIGKKIDGGGGGKIYMATAGGKNISKISEIFDYISIHIKSVLTDSKK